MATGVPLVCDCGHNITVHWTDAGGCQKCPCRGYGRPESQTEEREEPFDRPVMRDGSPVLTNGQTAFERYGIEPKQLAYVTLRELTPELRAHYACAPGTCDHPDCQPRICDGCDNPPHDGPCEF